MFETERHHLELFQRRQLKKKACTQLFEPIFPQRQVLRCLQIDVLSKAFIIINRLCIFSKFQQLIYKTECKSSCHQTLNLEVQASILSRNIHPPLQRAHLQGVLQPTNYFPAPTNQLNNLCRSFALVVLFFGVWLGFVCF